MHPDLRSLVALLCFSSLATAGGGANLIPNGNFEQDAMLQCRAQGTIPLPWKSLGSVDTYTSNCLVLPALDPWFPFQNFAQGFPAYEGYRFMAGWGSAGETLYVQLTSPLVPGRSYRVRGAFSRSLIHTAGDPYDVFLSTDAALNRSTDFLAGSIGRNTVQGAWTTDSFVFTAAGGEQYFFLDPRAGADCYLGADDLVLEPLVAAAPTRNGSGVNPTCYSSTTLPVLGSTWMAQVATSGHPGANLTFILGYAAPSSGTLPAYGELLVDVASPRLFRISAVPVGGIATYSIGVPSTPSLACLTA
jgi:hypothetical protein